MDRDVNAFAAADAWRVAALSAMGREELAAALSGSNAFAWVMAAAKAGLTEAQMRLGRMLLAGERTRRDEAAAFGWFARAAETGLADAHNMLGRCFENGWGAGRDLARAAHHYRTAAEAGDDWAQYNLGHLHLDGLGVARDLEAAFGWYAKAAGQGHIRAMNLLARCYEHGWGAAPDMALARAWYRKSAEGGYFRGAYNYATLLVAEGCIAGAALWFERALAAAPQPTRSAMATALSSSLHAELRRLGLGMNAQAGATEGLI
ncbi:MAG TPA: tetratricopeptide repeat protein [Rhizomicrobium sp.]|nr:tetratricopeptide repeat protein [Rhizomicrobium sp.]